MSESNRRNAYRISYPERLGLVASVSHLQKWHRVKVTNVSLTGILLERHPVVLAKRNLDDEVHLQLKVGSFAVELAAVVRRQLPNQFGLLFELDVPADQLNPPHPLLMLVMELQRRLVASRLL
jgi:PilZ domain